MINRTIALTKVFLKSLFIKRNDKKKKIGKYILYGLLIAYLIGVIVVGSKMLIDLLRTMRQTKVFIGFILSANIFMALFLTIVASVQVLYFSKDNLSVLPLPVRPMEITAAKINTLLAYEYMEEALLGLLPLAVYGVLTHQPLWYYPLMIIVLLLVPVVPLCVASFLVIALMSVSGKLRNKKLTQYITMILGIGLSVGISMFSSRMGSSSDTEMMDMLVHANGFLDKFRSLLPNLRFGIDTLVDGNMLSLFLLLLLSAGVYVLTVIASQKLYFKGMIGSLFDSSGISSKKIDEKKAYKSTGLSVSYVMKEFKSYLRRPTFVVQLIMPCVLLPLLMVGLMYVNMKRGFESQGLDIGFLISDLTSSPDMMRYFFGAVLLFVFFNVMYVFICVIAVSKDGKDAYFMKQIPVPFWKQVLYKAIPDILAVLFSTLLVLVCAGVLFKVPLSILIECMIIAIPFSVLHGALILFDLRAPKLTWTNELEIAKKNLRVFIPIGIDVGNMIIIALLVFLAKLSPVVTTAILFAVYTLIAVLLWGYIRRKDNALAEAIW